MSAKIFAGVAAAILMMGATTASAADCCKTSSHSDHQMVCCNHKNDPTAEAVLLPMVPPEPARPAVERLVVTFRNPVRVGDRVLMGKYVIEHDTDRMARGGPCTYIYELKDQRMPVVAFHCTHLERARTQRPTVTLVSTGDPSGVKRLTEFQFGGEAAGHGVPAGR